MPIEFHMFPCLQDNYGYLIHDKNTGATATIDTPDVKQIEKALKHKNWQLTHILNTHHHFDHAGGNLELKRKTGCTIVGPAADANRIPGIEVQVGDGDTYMLGEEPITIFDTPGHTSGHIVYYLNDSKMVFVGDTLFSLGCGRLFEGTPKEMWESIQKLIQLPDDTNVYCAHEYTLSNADFAITLEPNNKILLKRIKEVTAMRKKNLPSIPTNIGLERKTNPFMRPKSEEIRALLNMNEANDVEVFAEVRRRKDNFR
ncbi:MAG: hydroxyacylglutathione hydrolase [Pseudomonadota bacterium]|nr:hydroxyacylglutathione hydrolase [Pseudomonadota bacterium]